MIIPFCFSDAQDDSEPDDGGGRAEPSASFQQHASRRRQPARRALLLSSLQALLRFSRRAHRSAQALRRQAFSGSPDAPSRGKRRENAGHPAAAAHRRNVRQRAAPAAVSPPGFHGYPDFVPSRGVPVGRPGRTAEIGAGVAAEPAGGVADRAGAGGASFGQERRVRCEQRRKGERSEALAASEPRFVRDLRPNRGDRANSAESWIGSRGYRADGGADHEHAAEPGGTFSLSKRGNVETAPDGRGKVARFRREIDFGGGQRAFRAAFAAAIAAARGSFIRFDRILANERESRGAEGAGPHSGRWRDHVVCVLAASEFGRLRRIRSRRSPNSRRIPCVPARIASSASICGKRVVSPSISIFFTPCVAEFHRIHAEEPTNSLGVSLLALFPIALKCVETTSLAAYYPIPAEDGENCRLQSLLQRSERICIDLLLDNNQLSVSKLLETLDVNFETSKPDRA